MSAEAEEAEGSARGHLVVMVDRSPQRNTQQPNAGSGVVDVASSCNNKREEYSSESPALKM